MSEICPLLNGADGTRRIPDACLEQCGEILESSVSNQNSKHDEYTKFEDSACKHFASEISHETLQIGEQPAERIYSTLETCINCGDNLSEDSVSFDCIYSGTEA